MTPADVEPAAASRSSATTSRRPADHTSRSPRRIPAAAPTSPRCRRSDRGHRHRHDQRDRPPGSERCWVDPAWRRRGTGLALTEAAIDAAEAAGSRTLILVATNAGRADVRAARVHDRVVVRGSWRHRGSVARVTLSIPAIRPFREQDLARDDGSLDRAATGEDRGHLLSALATPRESARCTGRRARAAARRPWSGRHGAAARRSRRTSTTRWRSSRPARAAAATTGRVRAGLLDERDPASRAPGFGGRLDGGLARARLELVAEPLDWDPSASLGPVQPRHGLNTGAGRSSRAARWANRLAIRLPNLRGWPPVAPPDAADQSTLSNIRAYEIHAVETSKPPASSAGCRPPRVAGRFCRRCGLPYGDASAGRCRSSRSRPILLRDRRRRRTPAQPRAHPVSAVDLVRHQAEHDRTSRRRRRLARVASRGTTASGSAAGRRRSTRSAATSSPARSTPGATGRSPTTRSSRR